VGSGGFIEGRIVEIHYRWAENERDQVAAMAAKQFSAAWS